MEETQLSPFPFSTPLSILPSHFTSFACLMILLTVTVVFVQLLFLNICFISILLCYFYEICVVYFIIPP